MYGIPYTFRLLRHLAAFKQLDVNAINSKGMTALQIACAKGAYDCAKILLAHGVCTTRHVTCALISRTGRSHYL